MLSILLTCAVAVSTDTLPIKPLRVLLTCAVAVSADTIHRDAEYVFDVCCCCKY